MNAVKDAYSIFFLKRFQREKSLSVFGDTDRHDRYAFQMRQICRQVGNASFQFPAIVNSFAQNDLPIHGNTREEWLLEIDKEYDEDLGIEFENGLMDDYRSCHNKCIFCFIDQMPQGMRETLYFKDDDSRLSFLQGNYVTLTNMSDEDIERIIRYHLSPINISFQTTNPELRCKMLNNRFAGKALLKVQKLYDAGITMNGQIVLCKGINDGGELERSQQR